MSEQTNVKRSSQPPIRIVSCVVDEHLSSQLFAIVPEAKLLFSCGHWDHSLRATSLDSGKLVQCGTHHSDVVTCVSHAKYLGRWWLVTGSRDCTLMVWELNIDKDLPLGSNPIHILYGHDDAVSTVALNPEFDIIVSGSDDGTIIVHNLHSGIYVRSIVVGSKVATIPAVVAYSSPDMPKVNSETDLFLQPTVTNDVNSNTSASTSPAALTQHRKITWVGVSQEAYLITYSSDDQMLSTYSINGVLLATKIVPERLYAFVLSEDGKVLVTGGDSCLVVLRWVSSDFFLKLSHVSTDFISFIV